jgi:phage terminase small subunit
MGLTNRHQRFVDEYIIDLNATQAAIRAGYAPKAANKQAHLLMLRPDVQKAITEAQASRSERTKIDADWVLRRLADEADADLADLYDESGSLKPIKDWPPVWRKGLVAGVEVEELREEGAAVGFVRKVKLSDRIKRIELIGKHVGVQAFREQLGLSDPKGGPVQIEQIRRVIVDPRNRDA